MTDQPDPAPPAPRPNRAQRRAAAKANRPKRSPVELAWRRTFRGTGHEVDMLPARRQSKSMQRRQAKGGS